VESSLYLHIPFCAGTCDYCDFYSVQAQGNDPRFDHFIEVLLHDVQKSIHDFRVDCVPTLYIGGGTPSRLGPRPMKRLLSGLTTILPSIPGEVTVEVNPESATPDFISVCDASGVTRLSLGIQSRDENARKAVGRLGKADSINRCISDIKHLFGGSLSLDLISGLPFQTEKSLLDDIEFVSTSGANHVSLYALTLEAGTPLYARARADKSLLPEEYEADERWIRGRDALEEKGFTQYEVSNFSRPGEESRHNGRYWRMESYIGCGPGAVGTIVDEKRSKAVRYSWPSDVDSWLNEEASTHEANREEISRKDLIAECLIMGFRTRHGVDQAFFRKRFGASVEKFIGVTLDQWRKKGNAENDRPALTREGLLLLNGFLVSCLEELDSTYPKYEESRL